MATAVDDLTATETARRLKVEVNRVYLLLRVGRLVGRKVDGTWRVDPRSVEERLRKRATTTRGH